MAPRDSFQAETAGLDKSSARSYILPHIRQRFRSMTQLQKIVCHACGPTSSRFQENECSYGDNIEEQRWLSETPGRRDRNHCLFVALCWQFIVFVDQTFLHGSAAVSILFCEFQSSLWWMLTQVYQCPTHLQGSKTCLSFFHENE